jgi:uncharacterized repeat protein (TIGR01451 family)
MNGLDALARVVRALALSIMVSVLCLVPVTVQAATAATCAQVKIQIQQKLSLERQAFNATMRVENGLDVPIQNISVSLKFTDTNGNGVLGTADPNAANAVFFITAPDLNGVTAIDGTGVIAASADGQIDWLLIPSAGAGGQLPGGVLYYVGATLSYVIGNESRTIEVTPDTVTVKPQPVLNLDYFLPSEVYSDDPFTPETEAPVPFTLGVRVHNIGGGTATNTTIESAQPTIVENQQGLAIGFQILDSYVNDQPAAKTLLIPFGDILSGQSGVGRWRMTTTLSGQFTAISAAYTHADSLGGAATSLINSVQSHLLVHDVKVAQADRDDVRDFLALDGSTLRVYESDGIDTVVNDQSGSAQLKAAQNGHYTLTLPAGPGFAFARIVDPTAGQQAPTGFKRSDGTALPSENVWASKTRKADLTWEYYLNVFDVNSTGSYDIELAPGVATASIAGTVYKDANGNDLFDAGEAGMGAVPVVLNGTDAQNNVVNASSYTNSDGSFVFSQLPAGTYSVAAGSVTGYVDGTGTAGTLGGSAGIGSVTGIAIGLGQSGTGYALAKRVPPPPSADLAITWSAGKTQAKLGEVVPFQLAIANSGPATATAVVVQTQWPAGLQWTSAVPSQGSFDPGTGQWSLAELNNGATATLAITAYGTAPGLRTLSASVSSAVSDGNMTNNAASQNLTVAEAADLQVRLRSSTKQPKVGESVTLTLIVTNAGPSDAVTVSAGNSLLAGLSLTSAVASVGSFDSATHTWSLDSLAHGASATLTLTAIVLPTGDLGDTATVTSATEDPTLGNNTMSVKLRRCVRQSCPKEFSIIPMLELLLD